MSTPLLIALVVLAVIILVGNTMIAVAFLRGKGAGLNSLQGRDREAMDELHQRVKSLPQKRR